MNMVKKTIKFDKNKHKYLNFLNGSRSILIKDKLYIFGGVDKDNTPTKVAWVYYIKENELKTMHDMLNPHAYHSVQFLDYYKSIVVIGGENCTSCELYDMEMGRWRNLPDLKIPRANCILYLDKITHRLYSFFGILGKIAEKNNNFSETEHDGMNDAVSRRLEIFNKIRKQIIFQYPITKNKENIKPNKLKEILSKIIEEFLASSKNLNKNNQNNNIYNLKDFEELLKIKLEPENSNTNNILNNDTNKNTIIHNNSINNYKDKDSFNDNKNNNNKNKRKNNSKTKNPKSAIERLAETYDDLDIYIADEDIDNKKSKTQTRRTMDKNENRVNKNIKGKKSYTKENYKYIKNIIREKKNHKKEIKKNNSFSKSLRTSKSNKKANIKNENINLDSNLKVKTLANNTKTEYYSNKILDAGLSDLD